MQADIFFIISSVGFIILGLLAAIALGYLILILRRWYRITRKIDDGIASIGEEANAFFTGAMEHHLFSWLFGKKKSRREKE